MSSTNLLDISDLYNLSHARVLLTSQQLQLAAQLAQPIQNLDQRWQVYRSALGLLGFEQWLEENASLPNHPEFQLDTQAVSLREAAYANVLAIATNVDCAISSGRFKLCILSVDGPIEAQIAIPAAALDLLPWAGHFYVLMEVAEDEDEVAVRGFLTHDQYRQNQINNPIQPDQDWNYHIPLNWFNLNPDALLLNLRCLDINAISLPIAIPHNSIEAIQAKLSRDSFQQPLWNSLTFAEGMAILNQPEALRQSYARLANPNLISTTIETLRGTVISVNQWFQNQLDTTAAELGWMLLPTTGLGALRSGGESGLRGEGFEAVRNSLIEQGVEIPETACGAYRDLEWSSGGSVRLYTLTWLLDEPGGLLDEPGGLLDEPGAASEWTLAIALDLSSSDNTSTQLTLTIRDEQQTLVEESLVSSGQEILYAQVIGAIGERFWVTVNSSNGELVELAPFEYALSNL